MIYRKCPCLNTTKCCLNSVIWTWEAILIPKSFIENDMVVVHVIDDADNVEVENIEIPAYDIRSNKPLGVHSLRDKQIAFFQRLIKTKINNHNLDIAAPNEISLSLSISSKARGEAHKLKNLFIKKLDASNGNIFNEDVSLAYNYLEEIQKAIVFSYKAIESFCNEAIPDNYIYSKVNSKGIQERYEKDQIERWISTSEKVAEILPNILEGSSPKSEKFWPEFKELERLRNEIIHSKSNASSAILAKLFTDSIDKYVESSFAMLKFFIEHDPTNLLFPLGFGNSKIKILQVQNSDEIIKKIE